MKDDKQASALVAAVTALLLGLIRFYQLSLSYFFGRRCRFAPSCSEYTAEAIGKHGPWRGGWLGLLRIIDCRPGGGAGFDPVPEDLPDAGWRLWKLRPKSQ